MFSWVLVQECSKGFKIREWDFSPPLPKTQKYGPRTMFISMLGLWPKKRHLGGGFLWHTLCGLIIWVITSTIFSVVFVLRPNEECGGLKVVLYPWCPPSDFFFLETAPFHSLLVRNYRMQHKHWGTQDKK